MTLWIIKSLLHSGKLLREVVVTSLLVPQLLLHLLLHV